MMASSGASKAPPPTGQESGCAYDAGYMADISICTDPACDSTSQFVTQLYGLPTVHHIFHLYGQIKASNCLLNGSLTMLENAASAIVKPIHSRLEKQVAMADKQAARCVEAISQKYPFVQGNPARIMETIKTRSVRTVQKGTRVIVRSYPGQLLLKGVDLSLRATLSAGACLEKVANPPESPPPPSSSETSASTESPPTDSGSFPVVNVTQTLIKTCKSITLPGPVRKSVNVPVALLKKLTSLLKRFRHILRRIEGRKRRSHRHGSDAISPDRLNQIESRRKITPKKRSSSGMFQRVKLTTQRLLGLKQTSNPTSDKAVMTSISCKATDAEKKRKHDDILTEDSDDSLYNFDMDNYKSDEDPDFESPSDYSSTDSLEYGEGDTESDIEFEETFTGKTLNGKRIKEKPASSDNQEGKDIIASKGQPDSKGQLEAKKGGQDGDKTQQVDMKADKLSQLDVKKGNDIEKNKQVDTAKGKDAEKTVQVDIKKGKETEKTDKKPVVNAQPEKSELPSVAKGSVDAKVKQTPASKQVQGVHDASGDKAAAKCGDGHPVSADHRKN